MSEQKNNSADFVEVDAYERDGETIRDNVQRISGGETTLAKPDGEVSEPVSRDVLLDNLSKSRKVLAEAVKNSEAEEAKLEDLQARALAGDMSAVDLIDPQFQKVRKIHKLEAAAKTDFLIDEKKLLDLGILKPPAKIEEPRLLQIRDENQKVFFKNQISFSSDMNPLLKEELVEQLASWRGTSWEESRALIDSIPASLSDEDYDARVVSLFAETAGRPFNSDLLYVDLETTGLDHVTGHIIEIGIVRVGTDGKVKETLNERFDMSDKKLRDEWGTGPVDVHQIEPKDIVGLKTFEDPEVQKRIGAILNDRDTIFVAHNDAFENAYLSEHLDGYWEARSPKSGENIRRMYETGEMKPAPCIDTRMVSAFLCHSTENNRLATFTEGNGIPYENAHHAFEDAHMTYRALESFRKSFVDAGGKRPGAI